MKIGKREEEQLNMERNTKKKQNVEREHGMKKEKGKIREEEGGGRGRQEKKTRKGTYDD